MEPLLDMLLLAIIRGNPSPSGTDPYVRLNQAKSALFGIETKMGRPKGLDLKDLLFMAAGYIEDRGRWSYTPDWEVVWPSGAEAGARSLTQLAKDALAARQQNEPQIRSYANDGEEERRLARKFRDHRSYLLKLVAGWRGMEDDLFWLHVREVAETLNALGYKVSTSHVPLRDAPIPPE